MSESNTAARSRRRWIIGGSILGVLGLLVGATTFVNAHGGGWHHRSGPMNAEMIADRVEHGVKYVLSDVDATADQKAQVTAILQAAAKDVHALADQHFAAHKEIHEILSAESIDRVRLESVRESELRLADQASRRILQGIADAAEVLTPQQRAELVSKMEERRGWHHDAG
jgi:protein CpxP